MEQKAMPDMSANDEVAGGATREPPGQGTGNPIDEDQKSAEKYGSQYLRALHGDMGDMLRHYDKLHAQNENPKVIKHSSKLLDSIHKHSGETGVLHKSEFADADPLEHEEYVSKRKPFGGGKGKEEAEDDGEEETEEVAEEGKDDSEAEGKDKKKPFPPKEDKSLADDLSDVDMAAIMERLESLNGTLKNARPAGTV